MWLLPSLLRPKNLRRFMEAYAETATGKELVVYMWEDDPHRADYDSIRDDFYHLGTHWLWGDRLTAPQAMEFVRDNFYTKFLGFMGDDMVPLSKGWDQGLAGLAGDWNVAWGDDGIQGKNLATHAAVGRKLIETVGWWALPGVQHSFVDSAYHVIGLNVPGMLHYAQDCKFQHLHWINGKTDRDELYDFASSKFGDDKEAFMKWQDDLGPEGLKEIVKRVKEAQEPAGYTAAAAAG